MQSTQAQIRKREEKRRNLHSAGAASRDMAETFLDFIRLIIQFPAHYTAETLKRPLEVAAEVWNAVGAAEDEDQIGVAAVFAEREWAKAEGKPVSPTTSAAIRALAFRKWRHFRADRRIVATVDVCREGADVRISIGYGAPPRRFDPQVCASADRLGQPRPRVPWMCQVCQ